MAYRTQDEIRENEDRLVARIKEAQETRRRELAQAWGAGYQARIEDEYTAIEAYGTTYYDRTPNPYRDED